MINLWLTPFLIKANYSNWFVTHNMVLISAYWLNNHAQFLKNACLYVLSDQLTICVPFVPWLLFLRSINV